MFILKYLFFFFLPIFCFASIEEGLKLSEKGEYNKAFNHFYQLCKQKDFKACYFVGILYYEGKGIKQNYKEAFNNYKVSADNGFPDAQFNLALMLKEKNINMAIKYLELASNQNLPEAHFLLGLIYYEGIDVKQNYEKAFKYFSLAAEQQLPEAESNLGVMYSNGLGTEKNIEKGKEFLIRASLQGNQEATFNLSLFDK